MWAVEIEEQLHRGCDPCVITLASSRGGCDGWLLALSLLCSRSLVSTRRSGAFALLAAGVDGVWTPLTRDQLVVFHRFFQSSIDCGFCVSEARAEPGPLVPAVTRCTQKHWVMTAACTQTQSKRLLSASCVVFTVLFCPNQGRLWGICQVVFPLPRVRVTFCFHAYFRYSLCVEIQRLSEWLAHEKSPLGLIVLFSDQLFYFCCRKPWLGFRLWLLVKGKKRFAPTSMPRCGILISLLMLSSLMIR